MSVLEALKNIDLPGSFRGVHKPSVPVAVVEKPVLPGTGFKDFFPGFRPGEFVLQSRRTTGRILNRVVCLNMNMRWK